ncbi:MAG TPA: response regulator, partial [Humisphaera sp.]
RAQQLLADVRGMRVLAVDDNAAYREILGEQFRHWGFEVESAADGREALDKLRAAAADGRPFRVAVVDMLMPVLNGVEMAKQVKADTATAGTALLMLTSLDCPMNLEQLRSAGFAAYLTKPVRQSQLFDAMVEALATESIPPAAHERTGRPAAAQAASPAEATAEDDRPLDGLRVLLAEDNLVNQEVARELLGEFGCAVEVVGTGLLAVQAVARTPFDLVLMDCQMPDMDGFEAARRIRELERAGAVRGDGTGGRLPVVALTANAVEGDRQRCLDAGMDGYVTKPIDPEALVAAVKARVAPRRAGRAGGAAREDATASPTRLTPPPQPEPQAPTAAVPLDVPSLLRRCRGKGSLAERLLATFEQQLPAQLAALRETLDRHDLDALAKLAHQIKGAAANLSADPLRDAAAALERLGIARDSAAAAAGFAAVEQQLTRCLGFMPAAVEQTRAAAAPRTT